MWDIIYARFYKEMQCTLPFNTKIIKTTICIKDIDTDKLFYVLFIHKKAPIDNQYTLDISDNLYNKSSFVITVAFNQNTDKKLSKVFKNIKKIFSIHSFYSKLLDYSI